MIDFTSTFNDIAWPFILLLAWLLGEYLHRAIRLPRISVYAFIGFILAPAQIGILPDITPNGLLLANIAFGLLLFESGYRMNLRWLIANPWMLASSLLEAVLSFLAVYWLAIWFQQESTTALLLAALAMATSPAAIVRLINEQRSSGQVTERILNLSALSCVLSVFTFQIVLGLKLFESSGNLWQASYSSLIILLASIMLGGLAGMLIPVLLKIARGSNRDSTLAFTITLICLVVATHSLKLSPVAASLTFGLFVRHQRIVLGSSERGFGILGDLLSVFLFVFVAATLDWHHVLAGLGLGLALILVRQLAKLSGIGLLAHLSGISWRKGVLAGLISMPLSSYVVLMLEQTRYLGFNLFDQLAALVAASLILEIFGPIGIQRGLIRANEVADNGER